MKTGFLTVVAFAVLFILVRPSPAAASFTVCNDTSYKSVTVAFAASWYGDDGVTVENGSKGWYPIAKGACSILIGTDISRVDVFIYAYVTSDNSKTWTGTHKFCLDPNEKFLYRDPDPTPPCSSGRAFGMRYVETHGDESFTDDLTD